MSLIIQEGNVYTIYVTQWTLLHKETGNEGIVLPLPRALEKAT